MNLSFSRARVKSTRRGSTLIAVFWLLSILGLALFSAITLVKFESDLAASQTQGTTAAHFAERGIAIAANPIVERDDPLLNQVFEEGMSGFEARIESEGDKFDINLLLLNENPEIDDKGWLRELFYDWGMELEEAQALADALKDWVDANELEELNGAESSYYERQGFKDRPFNRPFYSLEEMRFVRGMDLLEQVNPNWEENFTIWTQSGIDLNEANADQIEMALNLNPEEAEQIVERVRGEDFIRGTEDDQPFQSVEEAVGESGLVYLSAADMAANGHRVTVGGQTTRLESTGWSGDIKRRIILIIRNREGNPTLLERREQIVQ